MSAHHFYALYLSSLDRRDEALNEIRRAQELDPRLDPLRADPRFQICCGESAFRHDRQN